jgi:hypothetical protein
VLLAHDSHLHFTEFAEVPSYLVKPVYILIRLH